MHVTKDHYVGIVNPSVTATAASDNLKSHVAKDAFTKRENIIDMACNKENMSHVSCNGSDIKHYTDQDKSDGCNNTAYRHTDNNSSNCCHSDLSHSISDDNEIHSDDMSISNITHDTISNSPLVASDKSRVPRLSYHKRGAMQSHSSNQSKHEHHSPNLETQNSLKGGNNYRRGNQYADQDSSSDYEDTISDLHCGSNDNTKLDRKYNYQTSTNSTTSDGTDISFSSSVMGNLDSNNEGRIYKPYYYERKVKRLNKSATNYLTQWLIDHYGKYCTICDMM